MTRNPSPNAAPTLAIAGCMTLAIPSLAAAAELRVDDDAAPGGDGSAASPFASIQAAIDAAADGDDILVAEGTYAPFELSAKEVDLAGGYDASFTTRLPETPSVVMGTASGPAVSLFEVGDTRLEGFTIRGGQRGIVIDADYLSTTNRPLVAGNVIEGNGDPAQIGGGLLASHCDAVFEGNIFRDNVGDRGAAAATQCNSVVFQGNTVEGNVGSGDHGGGLYLTGPSITVRGNLVRDNEIGVIAGYGWGGGVIVYGQDVQATFEQNLFTGNRAQSIGSAVFVDDGAVATFQGDLFYANECGEAGGAGLYVDGYDVIGSRATLTNVTIAAHDCPATMGNAIVAETGSMVELVNAIVWDNGGDDFTAIDTSSITASYTLSQEPIDGEGNLSADPLFADPAAGDFHVRSTQGRFDVDSGAWVQDDADSPTIDAGDPASEYAMEPGPNGLRVNLGHTGNTAQASMGGPGGEPPMGDDTGSNAESGDDSGDGVDATDDGGESAGGGADEGESAGGSDDDGGADTDETTMSCACSEAGAGSPGAALFALVIGVGMACARRRLRPA